MLEHDIKSEPEKQLIKELFNCVINMSEVSGETGSVAVVSKVMELTFVGSLIYITIEVIKTIVDSEPTLEILLYGFVVPALNALINVMLLSVLTGGKVFIFFVEVELYHTNIQKYIPYMLFPIGVNVMVFPETLTLLEILPDTDMVGLKIEEDVRATVPLYEPW